MAEISIRLVTGADLPELQRISQETFQDAFAASNTAENMKLYEEKAFSREQLLDEINNPESTFYFAVTDGLVAGYLKLNTGKAQGDLQDQNSLELARIYVRKEFQGQRIGQQLLDKTIAVAREKNVDFAWLGVWELNPGAIRFYERNGFKKFSTHFFMLGSDRQTDILMKLVINS